jgi:hypothetical protein
MILAIMVKPHQLSSLRTALAMGVIDQLAASDEPKLGLTWREQPSVINYLLISF